MSQRTRVVLGPAKPGNNQPAYPKLRISLVLSLWSLFSLFKQEGGWLWELKPKLPKKGDDQPIRLYIRGRSFIYMDMYIIYIYINCNRPGP